MKCVNKFKLGTSISKSHRTPPLGLILHFLVMDYIEELKILLS